MTLLLLGDTRYTTFQRIVNGFRNLYYDLVEVSGFEPLTYCVQSSRSPN